jgi:hypothetical protein
MKLLLMQFSPASYYLHQILFEVIKSKRTRWARHVTHKGEVWSENLTGRDYCEDLGIDAG